MSPWIGFWMPAGLASADAETRRRAQLLVRCAYVMMIIFPIMSIVYGLRGAPVLGYLVLGFGLAQPLTLIVLKYTGRLSWGAHTCCFLLWATFGSLLSFTGGVHAPILASNTLLIVLATMLAGERGGFIWAGVVAATLVSSLLRTQAGLGITQVLGQSALAEFRTAEPLATGFVTLSMCVIYERVKDQMLRAVEAERTRAAQAHADTKLILDNVGQGFVTLDMRGVVVGEYSAMAERWLPGLSANAAFIDVLRPVDAAVAEGFELAWEQLRDGFLPLELSLEQMPRQLHGGRDTYAIDYRPLLDDAGEAQRVVVILTDITAQLAQERAEAEQRELLSVFRRILADRGGVAEFLSEASELVQQVASDAGEDVEVKRWLHTLKGNSGLMGLHRFAALCHTLEDELELTGERLSREQRDELERTWQGLATTVSPFLGDHYHGDIVLDGDVYEHFLQRLLAGEAHSELARDARLWSYEPLDERLRRFGERAAALHQRLGKGKLSLLIETGGMRLSPGPFGPFWAAFVHVVRNAVDHGLESPEERAAAGKRVSPALALKSYLRDQTLVIEVADNGRGIDWDALGKKARALGLPADDEASLIDALFADGVSSRDEVSELSGRGVGLAAVKHSCEDLGGKIEVVSRPGHGTQFLFHFPLSRVDAGTLSHAA